MSNDLEGRIIQMRPRPNDAVKKTSIEVDMPRIRNLYKSGLQPPSQAKSLAPSKFTPDDSQQVKPPSAGSAWHVRGNNFEMSISGELVLV